MQITATHFIEEKKRFSFLKSLDEKVMLTIPSFGLILCTLVLGMNYTGITQIHATSEWSTFLTSLIFMDGLHVIFTFTLFYYLPELRAWTNSSENKPTQGWDRGWSFKHRAALIMLALFIIIFILKINPSSSTLKGMTTIWLFLELLGPSQHTAAQMRGISLVYNSNIRKSFSLTKAENQQLISAEKLERILFKILIVSDVAYWIPKIFVTDQIYIPGIRIIQSAGGMALIMSAIGLVINSFRYPKNDETEKSLFLTRVLLFPLKLLTPIGGLAIRATHGSEYLIIFRKMIQSSSIDSNKKKKAYQGTIVAALLYSLIFIMMWPGIIQKTFHLQISENLHWIAIALTFTIRFGHYYIDAVMFKMSDPFTRKSVGPLLQ